MNDMYFRNMKHVTKPENLFLIDLTKGKIFGLSSVNQFWISKEITSHRRSEIIVLWTSSLKCLLDTCVLMTLNEKSPFQNFSTVTFLIKG